MSEAGTGSSIASNCSQVKNAFCRRKGTGVCSRCGGGAAGGGDRHRPYSPEIIRPGCSPQEARKAKARPPVGGRPRGGGADGGDGGARAGGLGGGAREGWES